ncbi:MAG: hypothetical protein KDD70_05210 [Bdellovibrionales bacterium]|nr:hypothetical protein [Bdellovibrionales bacterium]
MLDLLTKPLTAGLDIATNPQKYSPDQEQTMNPLGRDLAAATLLIAGTRALVDAGQRLQLENSSSDIMDLLG